ncbi:MAG: hypothetical protein ABI895_11330 [Deltaproteobacteria bacterium]
MRSWLLLMGLFGLACSEDGGRTRDETVTEMVIGAAGSGGAADNTAPGTVAPGGTATPGTAAPATATPGVAAPGGDGTAAAAPPLALGNGMVLGDPLELVAGTGAVPYAIGPNAYGIRGGGFLARSTQGNTVTIGTEPGKICISGSLEEVPLNPDGHGNYGPYWGVEFGFNLNQAPAESGVATPPAGAPLPPSAAGGAAGAPATPPPDVAQPWHPGKVVGFSFVIEGPTIPLVRFKSLPDGYDSAQESSVFCKEISAAVSGSPNAALFGELSTYCWSGISTVLPTSGGLDNISWQLPADVAPAGVRPFDMCLKDLRPILAP